MTDPRTLARALEESGLAKPDDAEARRQQLVQILSDQAVSQGWGWEDPALLARAERSDQTGAYRPIPLIPPGTPREDIFPSSTGVIDAITAIGLRLTPDHLDRYSDNVIERGRQAPGIAGGNLQRELAREDIAARSKYLFNRSQAEQDYQWGKLSPEEKLEATPYRIDLAIGEVALPDPLTGLPSAPAPMFAMPPYGKGRIR